MTVVAYCSVAADGRTFDGQIILRDVEDAKARLGPVVQAAPSELAQPARSTAPILPPLTPPQQPAWKQELKDGGPATPEKTE